MKGAIFKLFEAFVEVSYGPEALEDLLDSAELETTEPFVGPGNYPPGDLLALVAKAVEVHETTTEELLRAFGRHAFPSLAGSVPTLLEGLDTPRDLLCNLESVIHTEVRKLDPEASPARFTVTELGPTEILLHYQSPFGLFPLVEGLLAGVGDWYDMPLHHELVQTEHTNATFLVRFSEVSGDEEPGLVGNARS
ncbi:MAG: heme NO-binding domain-containing protein [Acidimicrobiales bacterium]